MNIRAVDPHHVLLVARVAVARRLKREPTAIVAEIRLGIFSAECDLPDVAEMRLAGSSNNSPGRCWRRIGALNGLAAAAGKRCYSETKDCRWTKGRKIMSFSH